MNKPFINQTVKMLRFLPSGYVIRQGLRADAENLAALAIQVWLHTYATAGITPTISRYVLSEFTPERFEALLTNASATVLVGEANTNLIGYAVLNFGASCPESRNSEAELATLYVQEHFIGKGVGSALLESAEALAIQRTANPLWLTVNAKNSHAIAFYVRRGYTSLGVTYFKLGNESHKNLVLIGRDG